MPFDAMVARFGEPRQGDGVTTLHNVTTRHTLERPILAVRSLHQQEQKAAKSTVATVTQLQRLQKGNSSTLIAVRSPILQWVFTDAAANIYTVYDWKATTMFDRSLVSPARFRELSSYKWHIGAWNNVPWEPFKEWLFREVLANDPDVNAARREKLLSLFSKYDPDRLAYLEAAQMRAFIRKIGTKFRRPISEEYIEKTLRDFCEIDSNGNGKIHKMEFVNFFLVEYQDVPEEDFLEGLDSFDHTAHDVTDQSLRAVFWKLDKDGTGYIPAVVVKEVAESLASQCQVEYSEDLLVEALSQFEHTDGMGGFVSEDQFQTLLLEMFAKVDHRTFLNETGWFELSVAPERSELLRAVFHMHNQGDTMEAEEMRGYISKFGKLNGQELDDENVKRASLQFDGVDVNGDGTVTEQEFVDHFISQMMSTSDYDFHVTIKYFYEGYLNYY